MPPGIRDRTGLTPLLLLAVAAVALLAFGVDKKEQVHPSAVVPAYRGVEEAQAHRYEVLGLGSVHVWVQDPTREDAVNTGLLVALGAIGAVAWWRLRGAAPARSGHARRVFGALAVGAVALAADELLSLHETIGLNAPWLDDLPLIKRPDDAILAAYALAALVFALYARRVLLSSRRALAVLIPAWLLLVASAGLDVVTSQALEELLEIGCSLLLIAGFGILAAHATRQAEAGVPA